MNNTLHLPLRPGDEPASPGFRRRRHFHMSGEQRGAYVVSYIRLIRHRRIEFFFRLGHKAEAVLLRDTKPPATCHTSSSSQPHVPPPPRPYPTSLPPVLLFFASHPHLARSTSRRSPAHYRKTLNIQQQKLL
jgi:hypothetical protein